MKYEIWLVLLTACSGEPEPAAAGTFIDRLPGVDPWLAVTIEGDQAAAFVCGGPETLSTHTRWMTAALDGDHMRFEEDGWVLDLSATDDTLAGSLVDPQGVTLTVSALRPEEPIAGLFTAVDSGCRAGVIVATGEKAQGAWCDDLGNLSQVTPLMPLAQGPDGIEVVAVDAPGGARNFFVHPASVAEIVAGP